LKLKNGSLDVNDLGQAKVRWFGGETSFPKVSIKDIVQASDDDPKMKKIFKDNIVFIGSTAYGAHDLRHTPLHPQMPGVYFHMNMLDMLLKNRFFYSSDESNQYSFLLLIIGTILIILIQVLGHPILDIFGVVILTTGIYIFDTYYLLPEGYEIKLFFCLFSILSCYSWNTLLNFYLSNKDKAFLKSAFGNYISPELIDEMYDRGQPPELGGAEQLLTAYFTDIASFSTFSERLTATQLVELLNEYLTAMTDILLKENGTLDKYEGDAIIAFFGAPMPLEDHATRACSVALHMQKALDDLRIKWKSEGDKWPEIVCEMRMRIGINSGNIVTGNMGSTQRMNYTMMGDSVNLAARLEEAAKQYGIYTHVNKDTEVLTENKFEMRKLDTIKVVGKTKPVTTYDLLGFVGETSEDLLQLKTLFQKGLEYYNSKQFDKAIEQFKQSLVYENLRYPELEGKKTNPSLIYIDRCEEYIKNPPPADWDGIYTLTSK
ncbi:MAG: adenylate/guanylate cyclase domain-containing protein, partial [Bdellovibrionales bacterium]|nr:adenylate/guanylate cyclase domain-containing protein [Bdellovibrionales bacterium]